MAGKIPQNNIPDVGMDRYAVAVGKGAKIGTSGLMPCFGMVFRSQTSDERPVIALTHTSHLAPIQQVIEAVIGQMPIGANQPVTIEVAGGMAPFGVDYPGTVKEQQEVMDIAHSYGIAKTNFNLVSPEGPPLTMTVTPAGTSLELKEPGDTEEGEPIEDLLCLEDERMQNALDASIDEMEDELAQRIEDGIGEDRSVEDVVQEQQQFSVMTSAERRNIKRSIDQIEQEFKEIQKK